MVEGDDLIEIGERFGVSVDELKAHNKLASDEIEVGQHLAIPGGPADTAATATPSESTTARVPGPGALTGPPANPQYKYSTPMPQGVAAPSKIESRLGTLNLFDGFPDEATAQKLWDNLDFQRAVQAYLLAIPAVSQVADRNAVLTLGPVNRTVPIFEQLVDSRTLGLTFNDNTVYTWTWVNLKDGPLVVEIPPMELGAINNIWFQWVTDWGITGPDKGKGGKYLLLPPGYKGEIPEGYYVVKSPTYNLWLPWRIYLEDGKPGPGVEQTKKITKIYPLADADKPAPKLKYVDLSGKPFNISVSPADYTFWELLNQVVQEEPTESLDQIRLGYFAAIGIQKGKPFAPDERMKKILTEAAAVGDATARTIAYHWRQKDGYYYSNSNWQLPFVGGYLFQWQPGVMNLDAYSFFYFMATGVTPAMEEKMVGRGSQYAFCVPGCQGQAARRRKELQVAPAAEHPGQGVLVGDPVRQPDALDDSDRPTLPKREQPDQGATG